MDGRCSARLLPELSNFCCLPGRAGGSPLGISMAPRTAIDVLVPERVSGTSQLRLAHYRLESPRAGGSPGPWKQLDHVTDNTAGSASLIQSSFKTSGQGRLEALVLEG